MGEISLSCNQVVEQEPKLRLLESGFLSMAMVNLLAQKVRVVFEVKLNYAKNTVKVPLDPQSPLVENFCLVGRRRW
jgi:hypothetical protein